ncbi:MAG: DEAD/DEAH box helicase, partial [Actinomycetota bacterium]|nr:DEAD/DEAH box helicase [Actinomycetota bacterium]
MSKSFQELGVSAPVIRALETTGITQPFSIQNLVLPDALAGLDILAESPTGSGKTLAFGLPLIERTAGSNARPGALVLVPTRELALQVAADLRPLAKAKGLRVETVYGGAPIGMQIKKARDAHVLVATPGRLFDLIERRAVNLNDVRVLVLDEADRMLDMGFKPQVDRILRGVPTNRQTMLFSATFDGAVAELARNYTVKATHVRGTLPAEAERGEVEHSFVAVTAEDKLDRLVEQLRLDRGLALVFVRTKHGADKLARKLERQHNIKAVAMHGNLSQNQRERALAQFESGRVSTLVATDVAARGLDVDDITHVINF